MLLALLLSACSAAYLTLGARGSWDFILPFRGAKLAALLLVGIAMSTATLLFQSITGNRILTPSIMGFDALFLLILSALVFCLGGHGYMTMDDGPAMLLNAALLCGASLLLFGAVLKAGRNDIMRLILTGVVTGMQIPVPMFGPDSRIRVYAASIRDRGTGSTKVRAGRSYSMSRELELVAGRLCDSPGCAESANP